MAGNYKQVKAIEAKNKNGCFLLILILTRKVVFTS